ncbi:MAG: transposase [Acetobacteraceae bacterium]
MLQHLVADADNEYAMIGSTIVRAHQHGAGAQKRWFGSGDRALARRTERQDPRFGRLSRQPASLLLTGGQAHDLTGGDHFLRGMQADLLIADKGFDADERVLEPLAATGKAAVIPPRRHRSCPRDFDRHPYKERHLTENFFGKIKQFPEIATRYHKTAGNFLAAVHLLATTIWRNRRQALVSITGDGRPPWAVSGRGAWGDPCWRCSNPWGLTRFIASGQEWREYGTVNRSGRLVAAPPAE